MSTKRVLVVGLGNMGMSHALAYARIPEFDVVGVCTRRIADKKLPEALAGAKRYSSYDQALAEVPDDINAHTRTNQILWHHADMTKPDERIDMTDEPDHDALCEREQRYLLKAIDEDIDLSDHMNDGVKSLRIVLAADQSIRTATVVTL